MWLTTYAGKPNNEVAAHVGPTKTWIKTPLFILTFVTLSSVIFAGLGFTHWASDNSYELGEKGLEQWRRNGWVEMMHYALGEPRKIHYEFYSDAGRYDSESSCVQVPTLVIQGRHDVVVNPMVVKEFVSTRPHANLVMVDDDHQLGKSFDRMWAEIASFLDLDGTP